MASGPAVIGHGGSPAADLAIDRLAEVIGRRAVPVVVVWEPGIAFELMQPGLQPAPIDIRAVLEVDEVVYKRSQKLAEQGADRARKCGLDAEALAVAVAVSVAVALTVPATLIRLARGRDAPAVAVGDRGHSGVREFLLAALRGSSFAALPAR